MDYTYRTPDVEEDADCWEQRLRRETRCGATNIPQGLKPVSYMQVYVGAEAPTP